MNLNTSFANIDTVVLHDADTAGVDVTSMTAAQADGLHFTGSTGALNVIASAGSQTLFGTSQDDVFHGSNAGGLIAGRDVVDLGNTAGADTIKWSADANQMKVLNFAALADDQTSQNDVLDFSLLSGLHNPNGSVTYEALVTDADANPSPAITAKIVGLTDLYAGDTAATVESLFKNSGAFLNNLVNVGTAEAPADIVFLIANNAAGGDVNVWHWVDSRGATLLAPSDGNVQAAELTLLGTLSGVHKEDLLNINIHLV